METIDLHPGDTCPNCGGDFARLRSLTPDDYRRMFDRENPQPVPPLTDTANPDQIDDLGALHRCQRCGYRTRFPLEDSERAAPRGEPSGRERDARRRGGDQDEDRGARELAASKRRIAELEAQLRTQQGAPNT